MTYLYSKIVAVLLAPFLMWGQVIAPEPVNLGASLPGATAVFETSLAAPITSSATSLTLAANSVRGGGSISGYNCFTIDEGSAQAETVCGTVSGTSVTSMSRGISQATGTTTVAALQFSHRRGANVKITDFPLIQILKAQNNGEDTFSTPIKYDSAIATSTIAADRTNIPSVGLVQDIAFNGAAVISATTAARGVSELATQVEVASSTGNGSSGPLVIPASAATSTYNSATAALRVVTTQNNGKIDPYFVATSSLGLASSANATFTGTTTMATTTLNGRYVSVISSSVATGTQTTLSISGIPDSDFLKVYIMASTTSTPTGIDIKFNGDASAIYDSVAYKFGTTGSTNNINGTSLNPSGLSISQDVLEFDVLEIMNYPTAPKYGKITMLNSQRGVPLNATSTVVFNYKNSTSRIKNIVVTALSGGALMPGSFIKVISDEQPF